MDLVLRVLRLTSAEGPGLMLGTFPALRISAERTKEENENTTSG